MARHPARRHRRDRRLQGARARRGWPPRPATPCASIQTRGRQRFVGARLVRRAHRRAGARRRVRARPAARRVPRPAAARARPALPPRAGRATPTLSLIAPASANTIAKLAHGLADNLLTSAALAADVPGARRAGDEPRDVRAPRDAGQPRDAARARARRVLEPGTGALGSQGRVGRRAAARAGRAAGRRRGASPPPAAPAPLDGLRVLVTAGGTREPIDAVRYVGNRSSGRMGFALADEAARRGAARHRRRRQRRPAAPPAASRYVDVQTAAELRGACEARFADCDVLLMAAAVADFRPRDAHAGKLKKDARRRARARARAHRRRAVQRSPPSRRPGQTLVGFAAEHGDGAVALRARQARRKGLDAVVVNDIARAGHRLRRADNEVTIVTAGERAHVPRASEGRRSRAPSSTRR